MHNLFDISTYGEVQMNNVFSSNQKTKQTTGNDHSVSLVQMQASLDFDDLKAFKKNSNVGSG